MKKSISRFKLYIFAGIAVVLVAGIGTLSYVSKSDSFKSWLEDIRKSQEKITDPKEKKKTEQPEEEKEAPQVKAFKVGRTDFIDTINSIGTIEGIQETNLRFEANGVVKAFNFREGDLVKKDEIIAELDHNDANLAIRFKQAKFDAAKTTVLSSKKNLEITEKLFRTGAVIKLRLDEVKLEYEKHLNEMKAAKAEVDKAKAELEKTYLVSPKDGVLKKKEIETGEYVTTSVKVATLVEINSVYSVFGVIEKDANRVQVGQPVQVRVDTYPDHTFDGEIDAVPPSIGKHERLLTIKGRLSNPDNKLLPGMFCRIQTTVYRKDNAIVIPQSGLNYTDEEGHTVFVVARSSKAGKPKAEKKVEKKDEIAALMDFTLEDTEEKKEKSPKGDTIVKREIIVGYSTPEHAEIEEGLEEGEMIIIDCQIPLQDNQKVEIIEEQEGIQ